MFYIQLYSLLGYKIFIAKAPMNLLVSNLTYRRVTDDVDLHSRY